MKTWCIDGGYPTATEVCPGTESNFGPKSDTFSQFFSRVQRGSILRIVWRYDGGRRYEGGAFRVLESVF